MMRKVTTIDVITLVRELGKETCLNGDIIKRAECFINFLKDEKKIDKILAESLPRPEKDVYLNDEDKDKYRREFLKAILEDLIYVLDY